MSLLIDPSLDVLWRHSGYYDSDIFRGTVVGLVPKATADRLKLPTNDVEPDTIPGPTIGGTEGAPPSPARLQGWE